MMPARSDKKSKPTPQHILNLASQYLRRRMTAQQIASEVSEITEQQ
jgi:hypothetical protein